jgi:hypothetical protein
MAQYARVRPQPAELPPEIAEGDRAHRAAPRRARGGRRRRVDRRADDRSSAARGPATNTDDDGAIAMAEPARANMIAVRRFETRNATRGQSDFLPSRRNRARTVFWAEERTKARASPARSAGRTTSL